MTTTEPVLPHRVKTSLPADIDTSPPAPLATFLGLFSLGLGAAELFAAPQMAALTGVPRPELLRAYGAREIATGIGLLTTRRPALWLWGRVLGDVMDLATLAATAEMVDRDVSSG